MTFEPLPHTHTEDAHAGNVSSGGPLLRGVFPLAKDPLGGEPEPFFQGAGGGPRVDIRGSGCNRRPSALGSRKWALKQNENGSLMARPPPHDTAVITTRGERTPPPPRVADNRRFNSKTFPGRGGRRHFWCFPPRGTSISNWTALSKTSSLWGGSPSQKPG